ncbi:uncharacterized protein yc1106_00961 [Curvularia clavata]|uniref:Uncharacterized protein n=1 Tax=Curvularia clavata TaxID=95742 RepID=A0A9Q9DNP8_CURCL|nr:uncharacterized protein yc1106_00961 [Curvularia clavata]
MTLSALTENLKLTSGDDLVTKVTPYLVSDNEYFTSDVPSSGSSGAEESHLASTTAVVNDIEGVENHAEDAANPVSKTTPRRRLKRSVGDSTISSGPRHEPETAVVALNAFRSKNYMYHLQHAVLFLAHTSLQLSRTSGGRSATKPRYKLKSGEQKAAESSMSFHHDPRLGRPRHGLTGNKTLTETRPVSTRCTALRSSSDSDLAGAFKGPKPHACDPPSKSYVKYRAKSDTSMPPSALQRCKTEAGSKALPRIKTVSFKSNNRNDREHSHLAPAVNSISKSSIDALMHDEITNSSRANKQRRMVRNFFLFPNAICVAKSSVADPAITRTDVHVIAIPPSRDARNIANVEGIDPATSTMPTIETRNDSYEVIWDDIMPELNTRVRGRRSSSTGHSLETVSSGARHGLERVDSKLAHWSGTWNRASDSFKPTIVVFPDDDGRARGFECTIEDQADPPLPAPPNSQVTSVTSSRNASRPESRSLTRTASREDMLPGVLANGRHQHALPDLPPPSEEAFFVARPRFPRKKQRNKYSAMVRQLSSLKEADSNFYGHRDAVSLTHAHLIRSERASPTPFEHQDSYIIVKQRMKNGAEDMLVESTSSSSNDLSTRIDSGVPEVSLSVVKEHAAHTLKNSRPVSILRSPQHLTDQQHIRIVE